MASRLGSAPGAALGLCRHIESRSFSSLHGFNIMLIKAFYPETPALIHHCGKRGKHLVFSSPIFEVSPW